VPDDRRERKSGKATEALLESFAALLTLIGCAGVVVIFIGLLWRCIQWAWS
jgi:hypothetical protein